MPFARDTLTEVRQKVAQDIGADTLLRFSNMRILGVAMADLAHLHFGYLDWIAKQAVPFTSTDEFLEGWAALKNVFREEPTEATGAFTFVGTPTTVIGNGVLITRGDGVQYLSTASVEVDGGGNAVVPAEAVPDPLGMLGANGNCEVGTAVTLAVAIPGVSSSGLVSTRFEGGADLEPTEAFRTRMLEAYQNQAQGGSKRDYVKWAKEASPGVTRAWAVGNALGSGTVVVYIMLDVTEAAFNGFPQGVNGVATDEPRPGTKATGDQLVVANYTYELQPVTAMVYVVAPTAHPIAFTIAGIDPGDRPLVQSAIDDVFLREGSPEGGTNGTINIDHVWSAISAITGADGFIITTPAGHITNTLGQLPTRGTITWT